MKKHTVAKMLAVNTRSISGKKNYYQNHILRDKCFHSVLTSKLIQNAIPNNNDQKSAQYIDPAISSTSRDSTAYTTVTAILNPIIYNLPPQMQIHMRQ